MKNYELVYVLRPVIEDEAKDAVLDKVIPLSCETISKKHNIAKIGYNS